MANTQSIRSMLVFDNFMRTATESWGAVSPLGGVSWTPAHDVYMSVEKGVTYPNRALASILTPPFSARKVAELATVSRGYFAHQEVLFRYSYRDNVSGRIGATLRSRYGDTGSLNGAVSCFIDPADSKLKIAVQTFLGAFVVLSSADLVPTLTTYATANASYWLRASINDGLVTASAWSWDDADGGANATTITAIVDADDVHPSGYVGVMTQGGDATTQFDLDNFYLWDLSRDLDTARPASIIDTFGRESYGSWSQASSGLIWTGFAGDFANRHGFTNSNGLFYLPNDNTAHVVTAATSRAGLLGPLYARSVQASAVFTQYANAAPEVWLVALPDADESLSAPRVKTGYYATFDGTGTLTLKKRNSPSSEVTLGTASMGFTPTTQAVRVKIRATPTQVMALAYNTVGSEPAWQVTVTDSAFAYGFCGVGGHKVAGTNPEVVLSEFKIDDISTANSITALTLVTSNLTDNSADLSVTISGDSNDSAKSGRILYRKDGESTWTALNNNRPVNGSPETAHTLGGLEPNTTYDLRFGVVESDGIIGGVDTVFTFRTISRYARSRYGLPGTQTNSIIERFATGTLSSTALRTYSVEGTIFAEGDKVFGHVAVTGDANNTRTGQVRVRSLGGIVGAHRPAGGQRSAGAFSLHFDQLDEDFSDPVSMSQDAEALGLPRGLVGELTLEANTLYEMEVTIDDADGLVGQSLFLGQTATTGWELKPIALSAFATDTNVELVAKYDYDVNHNANVIMQYRNVRSQIWINVDPQYIVRDNAEETFSTVIAGLNPSTSYAARAVFSDPDGILPTAPSQLDVVFTTRGLVPSGEARRKHYVYKIYNFDDEYVGTWPEVPEPEFTLYQNGGVSDLTVTLPRTLSQIDTDPTIDFGNRIDVWAMDYQSDGMGANLVTDDEFNLGSWVLAGGASISSTAGPDGSKALVLANLVTQSATLSPIQYLTRQKIGGAWVERFQNVPLVATVICKPEAGGVAALVLNAKDANGNILDSYQVTSAGNGWQKLRAVYTPPVTTSFLSVELSGGGVASGGSAIFDKVTVRPQEMLVYRGRVETFTPTVDANKQIVKVEILGLISTITDDYIRFKQFVGHQPPGDAAKQRFNYGPSDASTMMREIIKEAQAANSGFELWFTDDSIKITDVPVEYTFRDQQIRNAMDKVRSLSPADWFYYVTPDGKINFQGPDDTRVHVLRLGVEIATYTNERSIRNMKNYVIVKGRQDADQSESSFGSVESLAFDQASINRYGKRVLFIRDAQIIDPSTADIIAQGRLAENNVVEQQAKIVIPDEKQLAYTGGALRGYNIESFQPGDYVVVVDPLTNGERTYWDEFKWDEGTWDDTGQKVLAQKVPIKKITYRGDSVQLDLSERQPSATAEFASLLKYMQMKEQDQAGLGEV
jgi:hypothetical protein